VRLILILPINTYLILQKDQFKVNEDSVTSKQEHQKEDKALARCHSFEKKLKFSSVVIQYQFPGIMVDIHPALLCSLQQMSKSAFLNTVYIHRPKKDRKQKHKSH